MQFHVKYISNGKALEEEREGLDKIAVYRKLKEEGYEVASVDELKSADKKNKKTIEDFLSRVNIKDKINLARNISGMLKAGLPLSRAIDVLIRQSGRKKLLQKTLRAINDDVKAGAPFNAALEKFPRIFPKIFVSMVRAGEESGGLSEALFVVADQMEKTYLIRKKIKGALIYPGIIITLMLAIAILLLIFVVPTLTATFAELNVELPTSTKFVIFLSSLFKNHWLILIIFVALSLGAFPTLARNEKSKRLLDYIVLKIPVIGTIIKETNSARTSRTLSSLLSAGVSFVIAIEITKDVVPNYFHQEVLAKAKDQVEKGDPISDIFSSNEDLYPPFVSEMMSVGEETGKLAETLLSVAKFYEDEVERKTQNISTIIEPVLMVVIGIAVGFFAVSMITPTYSVLSNI